MQARMRRSSPKHCVNVIEQKVHKLLGFIPGVSTLYNFATSIYYYTQNCIDLAKKRAQAGAIDLGFDTLVALSGGAGTPFRMGVAMALRQVFRKGVEAIILDFQKEEEPPCPVPTNRQLGIERLLFVVGWSRESSEGCEAGVGEGRHAIAVNMNKEIAVPREAAMYLSPSLMLVIFLGLLPHHGLGGQPVTTTDPRNHIENSISDSSLASLRTLLTSISSNSTQLPEKKVSCSDLMPDTFEHFDSVPRPAQIMIQATLVLALQNAGCSHHAETLGLELYQQLGQKDASGLLLTMIKILDTAKPTGENTSFAALQFNLDQLAQKQALHCRGLMQVDRALLHGEVYREYKWFSTAAAACHHLGNVCGGVITNGSSSFQVVLRNGSYFWPELPRVRTEVVTAMKARMRRSSPEHCVNATEQKVHQLLGFIPGVSTLYNFGSSIYYYIQDCIDLAKNRAQDGAIDLGFDTLVALSGGAATPLRMGFAIAMRPVFQKGVEALTVHFQKEEQPPYPVSALNITN
ncbi:Apolipoprotein F, partial [Ophiophagus hannah]